jgi:tetratricopeptide (TPR) repeat protein
MSMLDSDSPAPEGQATDVNGDGHANGAPTSSPDLRAADASPAVSPMSPTAPLDDGALFAQLLAMAQSAGRVDLVDELRRRAEGPGPAKHSRNGAKARPLVKKSLINEGLRFIREKKLNEAVERLREAARAEPGQQHDALGNLGVALAQLGRLGEAEMAFREAVRIRPDSATMQANLGRKAKGDIVNYALAKKRHWSFDFEKNSCPMVANKGQ